MSFTSSNLLHPIVGPNRRGAMRVRSVIAAANYAIVGRAGRDEEIDGGSR
jgi:hypothetical protein